MRILGLGLLALGGCTGAELRLDDSGGAEDSGSTQPPADGGEEELFGCGEPALSQDLPSHATDIQPIWSSRCSTCHTTSSNGELSLADAYDRIVEVPSSDLPTMVLVQPGDLDASYLWRKLSDTHEQVGGQGDWMPRGGQELSDDECALIASWIAGGAPP